MFEEWVHVGDKAVLGVHSLACRCSIICVSTLFRSANGGWVSCLACFSSASQEVWLRYESLWATLQILQEGVCWSASYTFMHTNNDAVLALFIMFQVLWCALPMFAFFQFLHSLCSESPVKMLQVQYRMLPEICHFPSLHFYEGNLQTEE